MLRTYASLSGAISYAPLFFCIILELISRRLKGQKLLGFEQINPIKVNIHQFYGIEINDFAVTVAMTALWIAESQMMHENGRIIEFDLDDLPLKSFTNIHCGYALRMDWNDLTPVALQPSEVKYFRSIAVTSQRPNIDLVD